ncbi:AraC family ligand binding domain-containing protein, partial [Inquilinus limosus]
MEIRRFRHDGRFDGPIHAHDRGQLFALDHGLALIRSGAGDWIMPSGRLCWMPAGVPHGVLTLGPVAGTSFYLDALGLPSWPAVLRPPPLALALLGRITEIGAGGSRPPGPAAGGAAGRAARRAGRAAAPADAARPA